MRENAGVNSPKCSPLIASDKTAASASVGGAREMLPAPLAVGHTAMVSPLVTSSRQWRNGGGNCRVAVTSHGLTYEQTTDARSGSDAEKARFEDIDYLIRFRCSAEMSFQF